MYLQTLDILRHKIYLVLFPVKVCVYYRKNKKRTRRYTDAGREWRLQSLKLYKQKQKTENTYISGRYEQINERLLTDDDRSKIYKQETCADFLFGVEPSERFFLWKNIISNRMFQLLSQLLKSLLVFPGVFRCYEH